MSGPLWSGKGRFLILLVLIAACIIAPSAAAEPDAANVSAGPQIVHLGTYVMDFSNYNERDGTFKTNYYVSLYSDRPVNTTDFEMVNGHADLVGLFTDTPGLKYFRVEATMDAQPDFHRYPFDRHTLQIIVEPRIRNADDLAIVIDQNASGLDPSAMLPGWEFTGSHDYVTNYSYGNGEAPYSRAVFTYDIARDSLSTFLKFFLPIMLIVIVSLSSLLMKVTSRLGLNASMFLAAVLLHWRIADTLPNIPYATFLDYFMVLTYATLVMVLVSGILTIRFSERHDQARIEQVNYWSIRIIPALSISLYILLSLTLLT